ncbi:MAG: hypothetical protein JNJ46_34110 [Myxococcales bacterium]|jgi:hypothetical protein|nr:hypothetical protein [Myxococcales bacterium]
MKQCPICGREVVSKRKDAVFCRDAACRKKAQQARKDEATKLPPVATGNKASVIVTFPNGSRWLLELSPIDVEHSALPSLAQVQTLPTALPPAVLPEPPPATVPEPLVAVSTSPLPAVLEPPPAVVNPAPATSVSLPPEVTRQKALRTIELFFIDAVGSLLRFREAVRARHNRPPAIRHFAKAQLCIVEDDGYGLGGRPGKWPEAFPQRSPTEFGLDADVGVLYYDEDDKRVYVPTPELLVEALGADWRMLLQTHADGDAR